MRERMRQNLTGPVSLILSGSLVAAILLLGGCGAQQADTAARPDEEEPVAAEQAEATDPSDADAAAEVPADNTVAEDADRRELAIEPPVLSSETKSNSLRMSRAAPLRMDAMAGPQRAAARVDDRAAMADEVHSMELEMAAPGADVADVRTGPSRPQSSELPRSSRREAAAQPYHDVTVFYATDRKSMEESEYADERAELGPLVIAASVTLLLMLLACFGWHRRLVLSLTVVGLLATLALGVRWGIGSWDRLEQTADPGVRYSNERGTLAYGTCDVTIPTSHTSGEIERPSILRLEVREDVAEHVVLQSTNPTAEGHFFDQLRSTVETAERPEVFVFVHGYNVTFDGAARRTAQIAYDVHFHGAPIFFSWPSQGGLLKYTVDENNVEWAVPHLRQFLVDVTKRSGAKSVNLIAHSMGNRALTSALRELQLQLGQETALFNQIILAAPDVDAEIFRRDLAPALVQSAQRVTLYASSNDQALVASKQVHGYARAGDSGAGLVVLPGIETIDVSKLDTSFLGHSYYGSSNPILSDIGQLIRDALPAAQRASLLPHRYGSLTYWVFARVRATAIRNRSTATQ